MSKRCAICNKPIDDFEARQFEGAHVDCYLESREAIELDAEEIDFSFNHNRKGMNDGRFKKRKDRTARN